MTEHSPPRHNGKIKLAHRVRNGRSKATRTAYPLHAVVVVRAHHANIVLVNVEKAGNGRFPWRFHRAILQALCGRIERAG